jgi:hypothetical protein
MGRFYSCTCPYCLSLAVLASPHIFTYIKGLKNPYTFNAQGTMCLLLSTSCWSPLFHRPTLPQRPTHLGNAPILPREKSRFATRIQTTAFKLQHLQITATASNYNNVRTTAAGKSSLPQERPPTTKTTLHLTPALRAFLPGGKMELLIGKERVLSGLNINSPVRRDEDFYVLIFRYSMPAYAQGI